MTRSLEPSVPRLIGPPAKSTAATSTVWLWSRRYLVSRVRHVVEPAAIIGAPDIDELRRVAHPDGRLEEQARP